MSSPTDQPPVEHVIEFGTEPEPAATARQRPGAALRGLASDPRVVPLTAVLAAVALFASLVSEWQVTVVAQSPIGREDAQPENLASRIDELGGLGAGFLIGVFLLAAAVVLVLFGPAPGRSYARLVGLSTGGVLLAVLASIASMIGDHTVAMDRAFVVGADQGQIVAGAGRGLACAVAGVLAALLALYLAGRRTPADDDAPGWFPRRPATAPDEQPPDEPLELTVAPARPFMSLTDRGDGISG